LKNDIYLPMKQFEHHPNPFDLPKNSQCLTIQNIPFLVGKRGWEALSLRPIYCIKHLNPY